MKFMQEETFGPVAFIVPFETEQEAIRLANDTDVGIAAYYSHRRHLPAVEGERGSKSWHGRDARRARKCC